MSVVTLDGVTYETDLMTDQAKEVIGLVAEVQSKLVTTNADESILQAAMVTLIVKLREQLTDEMIATEEVEQTEE
tara:strand:+ start:1231 stop:1455 length:225 start_codon:yes stop_codon:yes gene_type:complete